MLPNIKVKPQDLLILIFVGLVLLEVPQLVLPKMETKTVEAEVIGKTPLYLSDLPLENCSPWGRVFLCRDAEISSGKAYLTTLRAEDLTFQAFLPGGIPEGAILMGNLTLKNREVVAFHLLSERKEMLLNVSLIPVRELEVKKIPWQNRTQEADYLFRTSAVLLSEPPQGPLPDYVVKVEGNAIYVSPNFTDVDRILNDFGNLSPEFPDAIALCSGEQCETVTVYSMEPQGYWMAWEQNLTDLFGEYSAGTYQAKFMGEVSGRTLLSGSISLLSR